MLSNISFFQEKYSFLIMSSNSFFFSWDLVSWFFLWEGREIIINSQLFPFFLIILLSNTTANNTKIILLKVMFSFG